MDDNMDSKNDIKEGIKLYEELSEMWESAANMHPRKWQSNCVEVLKKIPKENRAAEIDLKNGEFPSVILRALGELSYANHCVQLRTFDSCYIWSTDLKKVGALFFGWVVRPKNAPEGVKIGCLGGFFK